MMLIGFFHTEVCKYEGIGRFVLWSVLRTLKIINSPDFVLYLKEKVQISVKKIQD